MQGGEKNAHVGDRVRVAFFAEILVEDLDGCTRTMFQILKQINPLQFDFLFICAEGPTSLFGFPCLCIPSLMLPMNHHYRIGLPILAKKKLRKILEEFDPQVVHIATPSLLGQFAAHYSSQKGLPVLTIYHTHFISYIDYYLSHLPFLIASVKAKVLEMQNHFYNQCDKIYIPSRSIASELIKGGVEPERVQLWKRGINTQLFSPQKRSLEMIEGVTGNKNKNILFASRLVWEKNLQTLFRIYDLIQERHLAYNLIIVGEGSARQACESHMPNAIFMGKLDHQSLATIYASSDVFLFPSVTETYGNVVLEAMASGLPCVIANGGGSKDFVVQGENGFRCTPNDAEEYVEKLQQILNNPFLATQFSEQGILASSQKEWQTLTDVYFNDLQQLVNFSPRTLLNIA